MLWRVLVVLLLSCAARADINVASSLGLQLKDVAQMRLTSSSRPQVDCDVLLAMRMPFLNSYFRADIQDPQFLGAAEPSTQKANRAFDRMMASIAGGIVSGTRDYFVHDEAKYYDDPDHATSAIKFKAEGPLKAQGFEMNELPMFYFLHRRHMPLTYTLVFQSHPIQGHNPNNTGWGPMALPSSVAVRNIECQLRVLLPLRKHKKPLGGRHDKLDIPFEIINCQHKEVYTNEFYLPNYRLRQDHKAMSADALEYAEIMALEGGFKWTRRPASIFARGVLKLQSWFSLRARQPMKIECEFVSIANDEPLTLQLRP